MFDYIVIGAGSAGCALVASLLAGDSTATVLPLEAGDPNEVAEIQDFTQAMSLRCTIYDWGYQSQPQTCMNKQTMPYDAGKANGGSSSINGMVWVRGNSADYDSWGALNPGWDYNSVLPVFMRQETYAGGASPYRGGTGPINVTTSLTSNPISNDFNAACVKMGYAAWSCVFAIERQAGALTPLRNQTGLLQRFRGSPHCQQTTFPGNRRVCYENRV